MQYVLTEDEYTELVGQAARAAARAEATLQGLCTRVADSEPCEAAYRPDGHPPVPWSCMLSVGHEHSCLPCPVHALCPNKHKASGK